MPEFWRIDPANGRLYHGEGEAYAETDLLTRSNGRYDVTSGSMRDLLAGGRSVAELDPLLDHTLSVDEEGNYWLSTTVPTEMVNSPQTEHVQWVGFVSGSVQRADGTILQIDREQTWATGFDKQLWVRDIENPGRGDWMQVQYDINTGKPIEIVPSTFRLASADEALEYATIGYLVSKQKSILSEIIASGQIDAEGNPIENFTDAAEWLTANLQTQAVRFQFLPRGEPAL